MKARVGSHAVEGVRSEFMWMKENERGLSPCARTRWHSSDTAEIGQKRNEKCFAPESSLSVFIEKNVGHEWIFFDVWKEGVERFRRINSQLTGETWECEQKSEWMNEWTESKSSTSYPSFLSFTTLSFCPLIKSITSWIQNSFFRSFSFIRRTTR